MMTEVYETSYESIWGIDLDYYIHLCSDAQLTCMPLREDTPI